MWKNLNKKQKKTTTLKSDYNPDMVYLQGFSPVLKPSFHPIQPDYSLLKTLLDFRTHSYSKEQDVFISYLLNYFEERGVTGEIDPYGNLYITKGEATVYPCVVAHTDINQDVVERPQVMHSDNFIFGMDDATGEQCGIGADDKVGVYFALEMFDRFKAIKLFFPKDEEVGLVGTSKANKNFFSDCSMLVQLDRRSSKNELITDTNGVVVCSDEFIEASKSLRQNYNYVTGIGSCTDIGDIAQFNTVDCVAMNVSCGYVNEHSSQEVISKPHFVNAINFGYELLNLGINKKWVHKTESLYGVVENTRYNSSYLLWTKEESREVTRFGQTFFIHNTDVENSEYLETAYPMYKDIEARKNLKHMADIDFTLPMTQAEIDESIIAGYCPSCQDFIDYDNSLLLYTQCYTCDSTFNLPE